MLKPHLSLQKKRMKMGKTDSENLSVYLKAKKALVDAALESVFSASQAPDSDLIVSMRYSLLAGGKRLRPILCLAGAEAVGGDVEAHILPIACSLELIHTYSLIHDDLPVMDNDDLRRGKPTNHKVFGDAIALLAGDGLLTEAFHLMTEPALASHIPADRLLQVIGQISRAAGYRGMIGGQVVDIQSEGKDLGIGLVEYMHSRKTGALIAASVASGAVLGGGDETQVRAITSYGEKIGLAFQIADDILDIEGDTAAMGKRSGADMEMNKLTYPAAMGMKKSKEIELELVNGAVQCLERFDRKADPLRWIARYIVERTK